MPIDKSLQQEYMYAAKDNGNWRDKKNLPINVIPFPFKKPFKDELDEMEKEREKLEKDKKTKKPIKRYASYDPEIDNPIMALEYWNERWLAHPLRNKFKTLKEFISWSMSNEDQPFNRGGIVSML